MTEFIMTIRVEVDLDDGDAIDDTVNNLDELDNTSTLASFIVIDEIVDDERAATIRSLLERTKDN